MRQADLAKLMIKKHLTRNCKMRKQVSFRNELLEFLTKMVES